MPDARCPAVPDVAPVRDVHAERDARAVRAVRAVRDVGCPPSSGPPFAARPGPSSRAAPGSPRRARRRARAGWCVAVLVAARLVPVLVAGAPRAPPRPRPAAAPVCVAVPLDGQGALSAPGACGPPPVATVCRDVTAGDTATERVTVSHCVPAA